MDNVSQIQEIGDMQIGSQDNGKDLKDLNEKIANMKLHHCIFPLWWNERIQEKYS